MNMLFVNTGLTRQVLLVERYALKWPRVTRPRRWPHARESRWRLFVAGVLHNLTEARDGSQGDVRLARTYWTLAGFLNCQERAQALPESREWKYLDYPDFKDIRPANLGLIGERVVLIDYGSGMPSL